MLETLAGIEHTIARGNLPPRIKYIIDEMQRTRPITDLQPSAKKDLNYILNLVEGPGILACIVGQLIAAIPEEAEIAAGTPVEQIRTEAELWDEAKATETDKLVLLLLDQHYVAYDQDAQIISAALNQHLFDEGRRVKVGLAVGQQTDWQDQLTEQQIDVVLMERDGDGYARTELLKAEEPAD